MPGGMPMQGLVSASDRIDAVVERIGKVAAWLFLADMIVICFDVVTRKFSIQIPGFGSTRLQELEWHIHTALFAFWLGLTYIKNGHVRIDVFTSHLPERTKAVLEVLGCLIFALPYCLLVVYYGWDFFERSWVQNEYSDAPTGLPARYIIKGILFLGLIVLLASVVSVLMRKLAFLGGAKMTQQAPARH